MLPLLILGGCAVGPDYQKPVVDTPTDWHWKKAEPGDEKAKGDWWEVFNDSQLNKLEQLAMANN